MKRIIALVAVLALSFSFAAADEIQLLGAGATFPYPLYSKMFDEYNKVTKIRVNYQSIGSGGGIQQLISKTVDFGASDAPMNDKETKGAKETVLHFPTCLGAVVITYNLPGNPELNFTPEIVAGIFLGKITRWNDPAIAAVNKGVTLPGTVITVVHRSDGSGTTYTFSDYLTSANSDWKKAVGTGKSLNWPVGLGGKGNEGVAGLVKQIPGSIGYIEVAYAKQNKMAFGKVQNKKGNFIEPTLETIAAAADVDIPADTKVSIVNTEAAKGYPICTFTWVIVYKEQGFGGRPKNRAEETVKLLWWMVHDGQKFNEDLNYGKLPQKVVKLSEAIINSVTYNGKNIRND